MDTLHVMVHQSVKDFVLHTLVDHQTGHSFLEFGQAFADLGGSLRKIEDHARLDHRAKDWQDCFAIFCTMHLSSEILGSRERYNES